MAACRRRPVPLSLSNLRITRSEMGRHMQQVLTDSELIQREDFLDYRDKLSDNRGLLVHVLTPGRARIIRAADQSRYFPVGRKRIKARIYKKLGRWRNCPGILVTLTCDPKCLSREQAWALIGCLRSEWINKVNRYRRRHKLEKAKYLAVIEEQPGTGYPHVHLVFPYLRYLAPVGVLNDLWGMAPNSVNLKACDNLAPAAYVVKYVAKMEGWSDLAQSYLWAKKLRLYSLSQDYVLPDYSDKRVPEWHFARTLNYCECLQLSDMVKFPLLEGTAEFMPGGPAWPGLDGPPGNTENN